MGAVTLGQHYEPGAVHIYSREVQVVGVLPRSDSAGEEPDLLAFFIDVFDRAHHPVALRDRVLHGAGGDVDSPEVAPATAFGHPQEFAARVQPVTPSLGCPIHHGFWGLLDHSADFSGAVDGQDPVLLMASLVVVDVEFLTVRSPLNIQCPALGEGVWIVLLVHVILSKSVHSKDPKTRVGQGISRLGIGV